MDLVHIGICRQDRTKRGLGQKMHFRRSHLLLQATDYRRRENDVPDRAETYDEELHVLFRVVQVFPKSLFGHGQGDKGNDEYDDPRDPGGLEITLSRYKRLE